jgi:hypothetical protein
MLSVARSAAARRAALGVQQVGPAVGLILGRKVRDADADQPEGAARCPAWSNSARGAR